VTRLLRGLPLSRLLIGLGVVVAVGVGASALALAMSAGPVPPAKPLAQAVHDALAAPRVDGVSARITLTNHLLEGASLASGGGGEASSLGASPLLSGASGRLWIGPEGHARLELQSEKGDTQILWDGRTAQMYDASTNTLYRYTPPSGSASSGAGAGSGASGTGMDGGGARGVPTEARVKQAIEHLEKHAIVSGATPTDVAGQAAYTVRVSPRETGSLIGGVELSWDAVYGVPLRAAVYSTQSATPVIELAASEISYGPPDSSALGFTPPANAKVQEVKPGGEGSGSSGGSTGGGEKPRVSTHGNGIASIVVVESKVREGSKATTSSTFQSLPKVDINGVKAAELQTALGTLLSFERSGVHYLVAGALAPNTIEAFARSL
jgi:hypothetical protein